MHQPLPEGEWYEKYGDTVKPATVRDCNRHTRYADKDDHMSNSYSNGQKAAFLPIE